MKPSSTVGICLALVTAMLCFSRKGVQGKFSFQLDVHGAGSLGVFVDGVEVIRHTPGSPFVFVGNGLFSFQGNLGNFVIEDYIQERIALRDFIVAEESDELTRIIFHRDGLMKGVGRNKSTEVTFKADRRNGGGGDYYTTYWAQPTFTSSRKYSCHFDTTSYFEFDFRHPDFHEVQIWNNRPGKIYFGVDDTFIGLVGKVTAFLGRQPLMPLWTQGGAILGVQGGTTAMLEYLKGAQGNSTLVSGLWIQDWVGRIKTSFGRRLFWNWEWNREQYPNLDTEIVRLREQGVRVFAYINPNLNREGSLFKEAEEQNLLVKNSSGQTYLVDFGEFFCGIVDMTNPAAFAWYKGIIRKNMIDLGFAGWMADFGEYLPTDAVFHSGQPGEELHNHWPVLWAKLNREAAEDAGLVEELLIWMRAGFSGSQRYCTMSWAGDQFVDFSLADGLASVIPAALSLGMSGFGLSHFDIGGYTSMFGIGRTKELLLRYAEFAAFTPVMRTHEGNRPSANWQFYSSTDTNLAFARHTKIFNALANYTQAVVRENTESGIPVQRPLFMHYENDQKSYNIKYEYLYGRDLLVAPVYNEGVDTWSVYLPPDNWVFLWDGQEYDGGSTVTVPAPLGKIPVFYRKGSPWTTVFIKLRKSAVPSVSPATSTKEPTRSGPAEGGLLHTLALAVMMALLLALTRWYCGRR
ncbi:uncharacterized protein LOC110978941 isoform X2 [Acanthaster planci]|uniref:Uncharacterized protein LOC110978941 isoform X2 n=1 Tax=Acanthaster planci TaxID=133434 RepID=A0A8B7Y9S6_ACAPL|nr:uncharacterized protein LOC110978941 isoform X2 [Acanthaster planci]